MITRIAKENLPNLFIPGAAKSATSTLHDLLNQHPDIYMSSVKEPHYFTNNTRFHDTDRYKSLFAGSENYRYRGESSTGYLAFPESPLKIKEEIGSEVKFIIIVRNPIDRAFSHYNWVKSKGREMRSFRKAFLYDMDKELDSNNHLGFGYKNYYKFGLYGEQLERYFELFPSENILVITNEALRKNSLETLNICFKFLELPLMENVIDLEKNKTVHISNPWLYFKFKAIGFRAERIFNLNPSNYFKLLGKLFFKDTVKLCAEDRDWVKKYYEKDVNQLKELLSSDLSSWKDFN